MRLPRRRVTRALALAGVAALLVPPGHAAWRLSRSVALARRSEPYEQHPAGARRHLLIVGDSTAVGTGASTPARSLAGLIGAAYPGLDIRHRGHVGARMADLPQQMQSAARCDVMLVQAGGNDVMRLRELDALQADLERVVRRARALAPVVLLMPCGNVGSAPFFFPPFNAWMTRRSRALHRFAEETARRHGVTYIDLFRERAEDPFAHDRRYLAGDGLHPSDSGYALWWQTLQEQVDPAVFQGPTSKEFR